ncbi:MAG: lysophospholipase, partial [Pirellulaceae bacterium]|nr:lysophospholipase [Pirellulaceae bacterium]
KTLAHARRLSIPVLLLHGTADPVTSFASSRAFAERAGALCTFLAWEGLFHELHFETQGDQVVQRMCDWMRGV